MILHVVLTILKVAGILLLALVLLVLALLFAILFVPIRYRLAAAFTESEKHGEIKISWLLHLISVKASVELPPSAGEEGEAASDEGFSTEEEKHPLSGISHMQMGVQIRILGMDPLAVRAYMQKRRQKKAENKRAKQKKPERTVKTRQDIHDSHTEISGQAKVPSQNGPPEYAKDDARVKEAGNPEQTEYLLQKENVGQSGEKTSQNGQTERTGQKKRNEYAYKSGSKTFLYKIRALCDTIKQIPDFARLLVRKGKKILRKPEQMKKKLTRFLGKIEKYEAREVLWDVWAQVKHMLRHFRVRKGSGYFHFGTGDPARTGELCGVLYLLLPASCGEIEIEPHFTDTMLETELILRGHIRLIHMVRFAWWAFFNKKLRRLIHAFRR
ncbi:MAG: DUF2953 domain-containing protein [Lachnospiraceae bacterium]|nr:DUF2953 domain-containing protein [Lachnospiraceae bacterium]